MTSTARTVSAIALATKRARQNALLPYRALRLLILGMAQIVRHMPSKARCLPLPRRELLVYMLVLLGINEGRR